MLESRFILLEHHRLSAQMSNEHFVREKKAHGKHLGAFGCDSKQTVWCDADISVDGDDDDADGGRLSSKELVQQSVVQVEDRFFCVCGCLQ